MVLSYTKVRILKVSHFVFVRDNFLMDQCLPNYQLFLPSDSPHSRCILYVLRIMNFMVNNNQIKKESKLEQMCLGGGSLIRILTVSIRIRTSVYTSVQIHVYKPVDMLERRDTYGQAQVYIRVIRGDHQY